MQLQKFSLITRKGVLKKTKQKAKTTPIPQHESKCKIDNWSCPYHDCMSDRCAHQHVTEVNKCDFGIRFCLKK